MRLLKLKIGNFFSSFAIIGFVSVILLAIFLFLWYSRNLPQPDKVIRREGFSSMILDRNEKPVFDIYSDKNRIPITFSDIPEYLKKATVAIEDKDFYKHQGFDPKGILRASFNMLTLRGMQGGSTLTQQLVKNVLLTTERTLPRKIKEFILSIQIERKYSKDEILQMYLNEAPYGGTMWGIESAANGYFGKHAKDLTILECAVLAGLPQRPSYYSPFGPDPKAYVARTEEVLRRMKEDAYITEAQEHELKRELPNIKFNKSANQLVAPHFVQYVKNLLIKQFGEKVVEGGGLRVTTTLDVDLQSKVESIVGEELDKIKNLNATNGAVVVIDPQTGEILAYMGSKTYESAEEPEFQGKFDVVSMGYRQPGSALKPITYAVAFSKNYTPSSLLMDVETHFPGGADNPDYVPKNYDNKFKGPVQIRYALGNSINIPAVKITALVGIKEVLKNAFNMGISTLEPTDKNIQRLGLSLTLGGGEVRLLDLTSAYGVFATRGIRNEPFSIIKVTDTSGKTLYEHKKTSGKKILGEDICFLISQILSDNNSRKDVFGENSYLVIPGKTVSVKTGTTDDKKDNWTVGYTSSVVIGVWVGNNDNTPMNPKLASGVTGAAPIWNRIIKEYLKDKKEEPLVKPDNIISLPIDSYGGGLPYENKPTRNEFFIKGTEPTSISSIYKKIKLSKKDNNKLANTVEIANGEYDEKSFIVFSENDPTSKDEKNKWQEGINEWLKSQSDPMFHPPADMSDNNQDNVVVKIKRPDNMSRTEDNNLNILAEAKAVKDIKKIELYIDGNLKTTVTNNYLDENIVLSDGRHKIKVKAYDTDDRNGESEIMIGVKTSAEEPTPIPTAVPTAIIPTPTITPKLTP